MIDGARIGRVRGARDQSYTAGVVCAKVARYAERIHHPERLLYPLKRTGPKGANQFARVTWEEALDEIGARFNVGMYSVLWPNDLSEDDVVRPGQELHIPPVPGVAYLVKPTDTLDGIAARFKVDPITVVDANGLRPGEPLPADRWIVVPGGELPIVVRPEAPVIRPALPSQRPVAPAPPRVAPAVRPAPAPAVPSAPAVATGRLQWPTRGSITTYYSGWHPGIDIAAPFGTPISVSDAGRVVYAGWDRNGYGNRIIVNHGNGFTTTYNHLSAFLVQVGQSVSKGQVIARMGSTGNSTGPHLHFEIRKENQYFDPLAKENNMTLWNLYPEEHAQLLAKIVALNVTRGGRQLPRLAMPGNQ